MTKNLQMPHGCVRNERKIRLLFWLCWLSYFTAYLGRLNYSACLVEIVNAESWRKSEAGLIATGFFITYGCGQLINGFLGDKLSPKYMVAFGLAGSGIINLAFPFLPSPQAATAFWAVNGFLQSMIWSPLVRAFSEWMPSERRLKACVNLNSTVPVGTLGAYGMSAALIGFGNWRLVFYTSGILLIVAALIWLWGIGNVENELEAPEMVEEPQRVEPSKKHGYSFGKLFAAAALPFCAGSLVIEGILKDGVTTWIPTFMEEQFGLLPAAAILCTTVVPIINLSGVYLASWINNRFIKNELFTASCFFALGASALVLLNFFSTASAVLSLLLLAMTTTFMMAVNTLLISMLPSYFVQYGICSSISGILNAAAYVGCALSSYGNGAVAEHYGWGRIMMLWCVCAAIGAVVCGLTGKKWMKFKNEIANM